MTRPLLTAVLFGLVLSLGACSCSSSSPRARPTPPVAVGGDVVATVNGTAITRADVALASAAGTSPRAGSAPPSPDAAAVLQDIVQQEVLAQRAVAARLDRDADFRQELGRREAQLAAWRRRELSDLYLRDQASRQPQVSEADARRYYEANRPALSTEVRVAQILMRDEARIQQALADLRGGASFDEVAARQFPALRDPASKPWELTFLRSSQLPEPWRPVIDGLAVGQTSDVLRGASDRFWIIKVLERRDNPAFTFEATRAEITARLQDQRRVEALSRLAREARRTAHVVLAHP